MLNPNSWREGEGPSRLQFLFWEIPFVVLIPCPEHIRRVSKTAKTLGTRLWWRKGPGDSAKAKGGITRNMLAA